MKHNILLPTDFSKNAWQAVQYALELYKNDICNFYILNAFNSKDHFLENLMISEPDKSKHEVAKLKSETELSNLFDRLLVSDNGNPKHHYKTISTFNNPLEAIKNAVEENDIEMIIMGTKGKTQSDKVVYGSNAITVMEKVRNCPIIVVPEETVIAMPKEIVFPTSYKTQYKRRELIYLIDIAKTCNSAIRILHVSDNELDTKQKERKTMLENYFKEVAHSSHQLSNFSVETAVRCFVESRESDMVAFINKKHAFFGSMLTQPLVKGLGYHSKVPILVLHDLRN